MIHTLGSIGEYCLGIKRGITTLAAANITIFSHKSHPSEVSIGCLVNVASGHTLRNRNIPNRDSRSMLR
jgi:hypothetical protein